MAARIKEEGIQQLGRQLLFKSCCLNTQCGSNVAVPGTKIKDYGGGQPIGGAAAALQKLLHEPQCGLNMAARIKEEGSQQLGWQLLFKSCCLNTQCGPNVAVLKSRIMVEDSQ